MTIPGSRLVRKFSLQHLFLIALSLIFWLLAIAIVIAPFDIRAADGSTNKKLLVGSVLFYWVIFLAIAAIAFNARRFWKEMLLALCSILMVLLVTEGALRILFPTRLKLVYHTVSSSRYHHVMPPNVTMSAKFKTSASRKNTPTLIKTNEDGFRTRYSKEDFIKHSKRIVVLGDSFPFGLAVQQQEATPQQLEATLREMWKSDDIAVLNTGILSYSPFLHDRLFNGIIKHYQPTTVLMLIDVTDIGDDHKYADELRQAGGQTFDLWDQPPAVYRGALHELLRPILYNLTKAAGEPVVHFMRLFNPDFGRFPPVYNYYDFKITLNGIEEKNRFFIFRHPLEDTQSYFEVTWNSILSVAEQVESVGAQFILIITPRYQHWNPEECPRNWELNEYKLEEPYQNEYFRFFESKQQEAPFPIHNLLTQFSQTSEYPLVFEIDPHWNPAGHAFVAKTLAEILTNSAR